MEGDEPQGSLMDDVEFLDELEKLEHAPGARTVKSAEESSMDGLDLGLDRGLVPDTAQARSWSERPMFREAEHREPAGQSALQIALAIGGFLLLMGVGAGAAALVFHDRVAQMLK